MSKVYLMVEGAGCASWLNVVSETGKVGFTASVLSDKWPGTSGPGIGEILAVKGAVLLQSFESGPQKR